MVKNINVIFLLKSITRESLYGTSEFAIPGMGEFEFVPERSDYYNWIFFIFEQFSDDSTHDLFKLGETGPCNKIPKPILNLKRGVIGTWKFRGRQSLVRLCILIGREKEPKLQR